MLNRFFLASICAALVGFVGCSNVPDGPKTVPAEGVLTLDGEPVEGANIVFIDAGGQYPAQARSAEDGSFSLNAFEYKTGAVPGTYKVIVQKTVVGKVEDKRALTGEGAEHAGEAAGESVRNVLPRKYASPRDDFTFTVPDDGVKDLKLELTSK